MKQYKHYSFDLWKTLLKGNPFIKQKMASYFFENYNPSSESLEEVDSLIRSLEKRCNKINKAVGRQIHSKEMYYFLLESLDFKDEITSELLFKIKLDMDSLFHLFPPNLYEDVLEVLTELKKKNDVTISILSNTSYFDGNALVHSLKINKLVGSGIIDNFFFSDETGISKPDVYAFRKMWTEMNSIRLDSLKSQLSKKDILHIGDDLVSDIKGAEDFGIDSYHIDHEKTKLTDLLG